MIDTTLWDQDKGLYETWLNFHSIAPETPFLSVKYVFQRSDWVFRDRVDLFVLLT